MNEDAGLRTIVKRINSLSNGLFLSGSSPDAFIPK